MPTAEQAHEPFRVLVFSRTAGYRHASIPDGIRAIRELGEANNFLVDASEDSAIFTSEKLAAYRVVIFLSTTGDVLDTPEQTAFEDFIARGGGFVGIHAASDTEYEWPWYGKLVGAYFASHPAIQDAVLTVEDTAHPSTAHLPARWTRRDEWYNFRSTPGKDIDSNKNNDTQKEKCSPIRVLLRLDEKSYQGGTMGKNHPISWCHEYKNGRAWYTGGGHTRESYAEPAFRAHLLGGILWAGARETISDTAQAKDAEPNQ